MKNKSTIITAYTIGVLLVIFSSFTLFAEEEGATNPLIAAPADAQPAGSAVPEFKTVVIDTQEWMAENLNIGTFRNGEVIPEAKTIAEWEAAYTNEAAAWCYYDNDPENGKKYGKLYNWYAVNDPRGLAPLGWHVPTDKEWQTLITASGGMSTAFSKLKAPEGFAAYPCGARYYKDASFNHLGTIGFWWSATKEDNWNAWYHALHFGYSQVGRDNGGMNTGHSVRCVKD
ncbi:MAG: fibrobacter succinogenes major paralogous domain-containing protein [Candidatus Omnitrophota bacterium]|jgi:uncharacterized protein (TIGR02145 family)